MKEAHAFNIRTFVADMALVDLENVFNPYRSYCEIYDRVDAAAIRRRNLRRYLAAVCTSGTDTLWMGRDLGYRGGRRTGLALTDEAHLPALNAVYACTIAERATRGRLVAERTAAEIWDILPRLSVLPMLWNVFPFHPHEASAGLTNRRFKGGELAAIHHLNRRLIEGLRIKRVVCIGGDAFAYAKTLVDDVVCIRHPSYGGVLSFRRGLQELYGEKVARGGLQSALF